MTTTVMRRFLKTGAVAAGAASGLVVAQLGFMAATYRTPPDAAGPRYGVIEEMTRRDELAAGTQHSGANAWWWRRLLSSQASCSYAQQPVGRCQPLRLVFIGDSLVTGVGCDVGEGPTIARRFAQVVADKLRVSVHWHALGKTGADIRTIGERLVRSEALRELVQAQGGRVDAVVLLCGLNDFKWLPGGRTASSFGGQLKELVEDIRGVCGEDVVVVLPALPIHLADFPRPLHFLVTAAGEAWDAQKQRLASTAAAGAAAARRVLFVGQPDIGLDSQQARRELLSWDGVHPNDAGYAKWADHLANEVLPHLRQIVHGAAGGRAASRGLLA